MTATLQPLKELAAKRPTALLLGAHAIIDAKATTTPEERMTAAAIADVITERHDLDALLDDVFGDDDFPGSYHDALLVALAAKGVEL